MTHFLLLSMVGLALLSAAMAARSHRRGDTVGCCLWCIDLGVAVPAALYYAIRLPA